MSLRESSPPYVVLEVFKGGHKTIQVEVQGSSMTPLIMAGDRVSLRPIALEDLHIGDILGFFEGQNLVLHRLAMIRTMNGRLWFCQKGDNSWNWSWIPEEMILGKLEAIRRSSRSFHMGHPPWIWINPCMGVASSALISTQEKTRNRDTVSPVHQAMAIFVRAGSHILKLLIRTCMAGFSSKGAWR